MSLTSNVIVFAIISFVSCNNGLAVHVVAFAEPLLALEHFQLKSKQCALVISDIRMPEMNGYEFIKKIKEIKPEVKVFLITAFQLDDIEFRRVLPSVKIDEFIQKPISLKDLAIQIRKYINPEIKTKTCI